MKYTITTACIAAISYATHNLDTLYSNWRREDNDSGVAQNRLTEALIDQIQDLQFRMRQNEDQDRVNSNQIDVLNSEAIVEDFFYTNKQSFQAAKQDCQPKIFVGAHETLDFSANLSFSWDTNAGASNFHFWLEKDGERVAVNVNDKIVSPDFRQNFSGSLIYREQLQDLGADYQLCYAVSDDLVGRQCPKGFYQYGYKVYGPGHEVKQNI